MSGSRPRPAITTLGCAQPTDSLLWSTSYSSIFVFRGMHTGGPTVHLTGGAALRRQRDATRLRRIFAQYNTGTPWYRRLAPEGRWFVPRVIAT